jgi:3-hydroxybutyryl-CoA dehydrogenase
LSFVRTVAVIGAGTMGTGIAQTIATAGYRVYLTDAEPRALKSVPKKIENNFNWMLENGIITKDKTKMAISNLAITNDRKTALGDADFVIEAVFENPDIKRRVFREADDICKRAAIFATNTSSISLKEIASATKRAPKCIGMHWWNPPHLMPLVEIVKGDKTSPGTIKIAKKLCASVGKSSIVCRDSPGLLGVRMQAALVVEALRILEEGLASPEEIDEAARLTLGLRLPVIGPLRLVDLGGLDVFLGAYNYLGRKLGSRFSPPEILGELVEKGNLGVKARKGFYEYSQNEIRAISSRRDEWAAEWIKKQRGARRSSN